MNYDVRITAQAKNDLRGIYEYIALVLLAPENAKGQLGRLESGILGLETMPFRFREYETEPWKSRGLRVMPVDNYVVFYIPSKEESIVTVIRVMYSGRDTDTQSSDEQIK